MPGTKSFFELQLWHGPPDKAPATGTPRLCMISTDYGCDLLLIQAPQRPGPYGVVGPTGDAWTPAVFWQPYLSAASYLDECSLPPSRPRATSTDDRARGATLDSSSLLS